MGHQPLLQLHRHRQSLRTQRSIAAITNPAGRLLLAAQLLKQRINTTRLLTVTQLIAALDQIDQILTMSAFQALELGQTILKNSQTMGIQWAP